MGAGIDPCAAVQTKFELGPDETTEIVFQIGEADSVDTVRTLVRYYWNADATAKAIQESQAAWDNVLSAITVSTPDLAVDLLLNRWLLYQVRSCRLWARSAFYQSGGAYGFRDQLQDVMALLHAAPEEARAQILRSAGRQFLEGDVQHWWHPPVGRGVRTRISDDLLWLPFVTSVYVETTGDSSILDEPAPYLKGPLLKPGEDDEFGVPSVADETGSLYEHCSRAIERGMRLGVHGLPLMGSGDWNDGMNRVGAGGKGESVWLAWFLIVCLRRFADVAAARGDLGRSSRYHEQAAAIAGAVEGSAWDGAWYLRAFFDDGTPLGSARNSECQIDSIAQSWGVLSAAADPERSRRAMKSVQERLVRPDDQLILLLTPPFNDGPMDPGYIKGYVPGIRENGAQYTHAATWVVQAVARLGQGRLAFELFQLLNPIHHGRNEQEVARYKVEPYVVAGDVFSQPPHVGRGGWTWYTGSAGWLYRTGIESLLGFRRSGGILTFDPCIPPQWTGFSLTYRFQSTRYQIVDRKPSRGRARSFGSLARRPAPRRSRDLLDRRWTGPLCACRDG